MNLARLVDATIAVVVIYIAVTGFNNLIRCLDRAAMREEALTPVPYIQQGETHGQVLLPRRLP